MPGIMAISDLHLGLSSSYLTLPDVRQQLFEVMKSKAGGRLDALILVGDVIDLAGGKFPEPWIAGREFFAELAGQDFDIKQVMYILGNHDHHLWVQLFESEVLLPRLGSLTRLDKLDLTRRYFRFPTPLHVLFPESLRKEVIFAYPYHSFTDKVSFTRFTFHHGHYLDPLITPLGVQAASKERKLEKIEAYNLSYMESMFYFFSWDVAVQDSELALYDMFSKTKAFAKMMQNLVRSPGETKSRFRRFLQRPRKFLGLQKKEAVAKDQDIPDNARRLDVLRKCISGGDSQPVKQDIWVLGHSHRRNEWPRIKTDSAVTVYNLGGWVAPPRSEWTHADAWPRPAVFHWERVTGASFQNIEITAGQKRLLTSRIGSLRQPINLKEPEPQNE